MNSPEQRLAELMDRWLQSLDLHLKYVSLTDDQYWLVQPWAPHQRPAPWILELARSRVLQLKSQIATRAAAGDAAFAESLELMAFLATLVGVQEIERYIPLAQAPAERPVNSESAKPASDTVMMPVAPGPRPSRAPKETATAKPAARDQGTTRTADSKTGTGSGSAARRVPSPDSVDGQIVADAIRLLKWGREWHELAPAIARFAGRPGIVEVRRRLRAYKAMIEDVAKT